LKPKIDPNNLRGLSEFLYLYKSQKKTAKTKATSHVQEAFMGSIWSKAQYIEPVLLGTLR